MTLEEIKLRRLANQYLITHTDKLTVVRDLCGIQAQFMVNAMHSLQIRCSDFDQATVGDGLVKNWSIRGLSMFLPRAICRCFCIVMMGVAIGIMNGTALLSGIKGRNGR